AAPAVARRRRRTAAVVDGGAASGEYESNTRRRAIGIVAFGFRVRWMTLECGGLLLWSAVACHRFGLGGVRRLDPPFSPPPRRPHPKAAASHRTPKAAASCRTPKMRRPNGKR